MRSGRTCTAKSLTRLLKPCIDIGKNLKPVVPASKWKHLLNCSEPNEEIQIDFGGPITNETDQDIQFLACIDRFSKNILL